MWPWVEFLSYHGGRYWQGQVALLVSQQLKVAGGLIFVWCDQEDAWSNFEKAACFVVILRYLERRLTLSPKCLVSLVSERLILSWCCLHKFGDKAISRNLHELLLTVLCQIILHSKFLVLEIGHLSSADFKLEVCFTA